MQFPAPTVGRYSRAKLSRSHQNFPLLPVDCPPSHKGYHRDMFLPDPLPEGHPSTKSSVAGSPSLGDTLADPAFPIPRSQGHPAFPWGFSLTRSVTHTSQFIDSTPGSQMNSRLGLQRPSMASMDRCNPRPEHANVPILSHGEHDDGCCRNRLGLLPTKLSIFENV